VFCSACQCQVALLWRSHEVVAVQVMPNRRLRPPGGRCCSGRGTEEAPAVGTTEGNVSPSRRVLVLRQVHAAKVQPAAQPGGMSRKWQIVGVCKPLVITMAMPKLSVSVVYASAAGSGSVR